MKYCGLIIWKIMYDDVPEIRKYLENIFKLNGYCMTLLTIFFSIFFHVLSFFIFKKLYFDGFKES